MNWYYLYAAVYAFLLIIFLVLIIKSNNYSWKIKVVIIILFLCYPFFAYGIVLRILGFGQHVSTILPKNIYKDL
jgi:hypothetical protein